MRCRFSRVYLCHCAVETELVLCLEAAARSLLFSGFSEIIPLSLGLWSSRL